MKGQFNIFAMALILILNVSLRSEAQYIDFQSRLIEVCRSGEIDFLNEEIYHGCVLLEIYEKNDEKMEKFFRLASLQ